MPSRCALPGDDHIEQLFESVEPLVLRDCVDGGAGDERAVVLVAIPYLDRERDLPGGGRVDLQGAFGAVAHGKLPGALEQDAVPAEIADDRRYRFLPLRHREREVLPARVRDFMPLLFPVVDFHGSAASGSADMSGASRSFQEHIYAKRNVLGRRFDREMNPGRDERVPRSSRRHGIIISGCTITALQVTSRCIRDRPNNLAFSVGAIE